MKTKFIKYIIMLFCITLFMLNNANAQMVFNGGANVGLVDFLGDNAPDHSFHPALGLRAQLCVTEKLSVLLGFQYTFSSSSTSFPIQVPSDSTDMFTGLPKSYASTNEVLKSHLYNIYLRGLYDFFGTTNNEGFGFYGYFGVGYMHEGVSASLSPAPDPTKYNTSLYTSSASTSGVTIDFGLGVDIPVQKFFIFGEVGLGLAANSANGEELDQSIPGMFELKAGIRYPFGDSSSR